MKALQVVLVGYCLVGAACSAVLLAQGKIMSENSAGVPWVVPGAGSIACLVAAGLLWLRSEVSGPDLRRFYNALAWVYAYGAACGANVPAAGVTGLNLPLFYGLVVAVPAGVYLLATLSRKAPRPMHRAAGCLALASLLALVAAISTGPPADDELAMLAAALVWLAVAAAPAVVLFCLPRRPTC